MPLHVYIDCLLKDVRNANHDAVKSCHLLAVAANVSEGTTQLSPNVFPALSYPFTVSLPVFIRSPVLFAGKKGLLFA